jgi:hypothetical protein
MSDFNVQKYALLCMRLAAECRGLAADVPESDPRTHFRRMASMWTELADQVFENKATPFTRHAALRDFFGVACFAV